VESGGELSMRAPARLAGLIELRGRGIVQRPHKEPVPLHLIVDLVPDLVRMLEEDQLVSDVAGVSVARVPVPYGDVVSLGHQMLLVIEAIAGLTRQPTAP